MKIKDLKLGKMYMFAKVGCIALQYQNPNLDWYAEKTRALPKQTPFIPIELLKIENSREGMLIQKLLTPFYRIKILLGDGTIWFLSSDVISLHRLKQLGE